MKFIKKPEFTQWRFHCLTERIRSKHQYLDNAHTKIDQSRTYTSWTNCLGRNKNKIECIYNGKRVSGNPRNDDWSNCIAWQKKKLNRIYDNLDTWRKLEDKLLKRMNANNFPSNESLIISEI